MKKLCSSSPAFSFSLLTLRVKNISQYLAVGEQLEPQQ